MTALASNKPRQHKVHQRQLNLAPVNAGSVLYIGSIVMREAASGVCVPGADTASCIPLGVVVEQTFPDDPSNLTSAIDNTSGADGAVTADDEQSVRCVRYDQAGEYAFVTSGATPKVGGAAYIVDDNTVTADAGTVTNDLIIGHFTRPAPNGGWFVDISRRGIA